MNELDDPDVRSSKRVSERSTALAIHRDWNRHDGLADTVEHGGLLAP